MKKLATTFLFLLLLLLSGCLEFDGQEITLTYDAKNDRIDILVVYRGLFVEDGSGSSDKPVEKALQDLATARETGKVAFWCNWPVAFALTGTDSAPPPVQALLEHVDVENGPLFTDAQGQLCGYQFVRIRSAKAFAKKLETMLQLAAQAALTTGMTGHGGRHQFDEDTAELLREYLRGGQRLLLIEPGRIELRLPLSAKDHAWVMQQVEREFVRGMSSELPRHQAVAKRRAEGGEPMDTSTGSSPVTLDAGGLDAAVTKAPAFRFFWDNPWSLQREPDLTRIGLGVRGNDAVRVTKAPEGFYHDSLLEALREKQETVEEGIADEELARRFSAFHERDAVLPEKVAASRKPK